MVEIKILSGLPASGKSQWAKEYMENNGNISRVNRDDLRQHLVNNKYSTNNEGFVNKAKMALIGLSVENDRNVILDDTHCDYNYLSHLIEYLNSLSSQLNKQIFIEVIDFNIDLDTCIERNANREMQIDKRAIYFMDKQKKELDYSSLNIDKYTVIDG